MSLHTPPKLWYPRAMLLSILISVLMLTTVVLVQSGGLVKEEPRLAAAVSGKILFGHAGDIWVAENGNIRPLTQGGRYWGQPDWAPSGSQVALVGWGSNVTDLFLLDTETGDMHQVTQSQRRTLQDSDWAFFPRWSPAGDLLGFTADRNTEYPMLWVSRPDGAAPRQITRAISPFDGVESFTWSPDGAVIALTRFTQSTSQIHLVNIAGPGASQQITNEPGGAFDPAWSPDGRYIAYTARSGRKTSIKIHDTSGGLPPFTLIDAEMVRSPRWAPNGSALAYIGIAGRDFELHVADITADADGMLSAGRPVLLTNRFGVDATSGLSWAP